MPDPNNSNQTNTLNSFGQSSQVNNPTPPTWASEDANEQTIFDQNAINSSQEQIPVQNPIPLPPLQNTNPQPIPDISSPDFQSPLQPRNNLGNSNQEFPEENIKAPSFISQEQNNQIPVQNLQTPTSTPAPKTPNVPPPSFAINNNPVPENSNQSNDGIVAASFNDDKGGGFKKLILPIAIVLIVIFIGFVVSQLFLNKPKSDGSSSSTSPESKTQGKQITLTYWGLWEGSNIMQQIFNDYEAANPNIKIKYVMQSKEDYRTRLQTNLVNAELGEPDIFRFHNTWLPMLKENLQPDPIKEINLNDYFPTVKKDVSLGGETFGVPLQFDSLALYYNPSMLQKAGYEVPTSWDELLKIAKDLTIRDEKGKIQISGIALGTTTNVDHFSEIIGLLIYQNGGNPADTRDKMAQGAFEFYVDFSKKYKIWDETLPPSTYAFATEKAAMMLAPSWRAFQIKEINPNLEFKTAPVPQLPGNEVAWASYWVEGVSRNSKNYKEAWKFLTYLSKDENLTKMYTTQSNSRLFGEPYPKISLAKSLESDPIVGAFVKQGPYAKSWYLCSRTYDDGLNDKIIKDYENSLNSVIAGTEINQIMLMLYQGVSKKLGDYNILTGGDAVQNGKTPGSL